MMTETVVNVQEAPNNNAANKPPQNNQQQQRPAGPLSWIKINFDHFKSVPGWIKIAEVILGILCASLGSPQYHGGTHFFLFVVVTSLIGTLIWIVIYVLGVREALTSLPIHWVLTEFLNTGICTVFYALAALVQLIVWGASYNGYYRGQNIAAGVFAIFNTAAYAFGSYLLYMEWKNSKPN